MAVDPIHARCSNCEAQLLLPQSIHDTAGRCRGCDPLLAPGYTFLLLEEARRAETLQRSLVLSLRRLQGLPGHLDLDVASVLRNALTEVDWDQQLADDRDVIRRHAARARPSRPRLAVTAGRRPSPPPRNRAGG